MAEETYGRRVHGEITSADMTVATEVIWYDRGNNIVTLGASQRLEIDWVNAHINASGFITFFLGSGAIQVAGELVVRFGITNTQTVGFIAFPVEARPQGADGKPLKASATVASLTEVTVGAQIFG